VVVCDRETEARLRFNPARKGRRRSYKRQVTPMEMARFSEHAANERKAEGRKKGRRRKLRKRGCVEAGGSEAEAEGRTARQRAKARRTKAPMHRVEESAEVTPFELRCEWTCGRHSLAPPKC
jgi:hypothetical protein